VRPFILRARLVLPIGLPPVENGAVLVSGSRIAAVSTWRNLSAEHAGSVVDLGDVVLMPGLVNAHCHLDYTDMAGMLPPPKVFIHWLQLMVETKAGWSESEYAASWQRGAQMLLRTGTTTVGDIEAVPQLLPAMWQASPLRVFSFLEMLGITNRRTPQIILDEALRKLGSLKHPRCRAGLSPHAPYTTLPELLNLTAREACRHHRRVCTHLAESPVESEMFQHGRGPMFEWLQRSGRDMADCGHRSPVQHLERCGLLNENLLAVHVNYLARGEAQLLGRRNVSVAHCPRSHFYFQHGPFPRRQLARAGVNICLGTDSLASVIKTRRDRPELNLFEEMRALVKAEPDLSPRAIIRMATVNGARALGMSGQVGELIPGACADLIAFPVTAGRAQLWEQVLHHAGPISASMINGKWVYGPAAAKRQEDGRP
jgi:aminodeoxyfutalosine deaminase